MSLAARIVPTHFVLFPVWAGADALALEESLRSLREAAGLGRVLIGVDGPLPEPQSSVLRALEAEGSPWSVHWFAHHRSLAPLLNDLIEVALQDDTCEIVFRMDADDRCWPQRFIRQAAFLKEHPAVDVVGTWARTIDSEGRGRGNIRKPVDDRLLKDRLPVDSPFVHPSVAFRAELLRAGHRYPTNTPLFEDVAFWAELALSGVRFSNVQEVLLDYRYTPATAQRRTGWLKAWVELKVRLNYVWHRLPFRIDLYCSSLLVFVVKTLLPPAALPPLMKLRTQWLELLDRLQAVRPRHGPP